MTSAFQSYLLTRTNSSFARRLQQPVARKLIVAGSAAWLIVMAFLFPLAVDDLWILALIDLPFLILALLLVLSVYGIFELPEETLDEHQLEIRNQAYKKAYGFTLVFLLLMVTVVFGLGLSRQHAFAVALMSFLAVALAPRAIAAWTLGSYDRDDENV